MNKFGHIDALELDPLGLASLRQIDLICNVYEIGIPSDLGLKWDVILACDIVEHIQDDRLAVQWTFDHLKPGGIFFATVPAFQWLFSEHDIALGHFRMYNSEAFDNLLLVELNRLSGSYFNSYLFPLGQASRMTWNIGRRLCK